MTGIISAEIKAVRNLQNVSFSAHPGFNVFYGINGSGKTSILEAIYILSSGKSFRHHSTQAVIHHELPALSIFSWILTGNSLNLIKKPAGIEKTKEGKTLIRLDGQSVASAAALAECLPLQIIHPESDILITGSPKWRRQFLDWGLFHVEPAFFPAWQRLQKVTKQRNAVLKQTQDRAQVSSWDPEYVQFSELVSEYRKNYLDQFQSYFQEMIKYFLPNKVMRLVYQRGWPEEADLINILSKNFYRDIQLGYTCYGAQRDDLVVFCEDAIASEVLSRGEQKLVVIALRLAQGRFLKEKSQKNCLYLLDDFAAELDSIHRRQVVEILSQLQSQIFLTTIDYQEVSDSLREIDLSLFHVEQGEVVAV
jgi:DNA replication and repair protein RecF